MNSFFDGLHYEQLHGINGRYVLLFHGLSADISIVRPIAKFLNKHGFSTLSFDYFGHGKTKVSGNFLKFSKIIRRFLDKENIKNVSIIGYSLGGFNAKNFVKNNPDIIDKIIMISSYLGVGRAILRQSLILFMKFISNGNKPTYKNLFKFSLMEGFYDKNSYKFDKWHNKLIKTSPKSVIKSFYEVLKDRTSITNFPVNILIIHGNNDRLVPIPSSKEITIIEGAGHLLPVEKPRKLNRIILSFLEENTP